MGFAEALNSMLDGKKVRRTCWKDNGILYIDYIGDDSFIFMKVENNKWVYSFTQRDILSIDWYVVD